MPRSPRRPLVLETLEPRLTPATFGSTYGFNLPGSNGRAVGVGDVDADGDADIAAASFTAGVTIFRNDGTGQFATGTTVGAPDPRSVELVDVDGDSKSDLVVATGNANAVQVSRGNGDGTFANTITVTVPDSARQALVADLNADGRRDLVVVSTNSFYVFLNTGTAAVYDGFTTFTPGTDADRGALGDFNADGRPDLALAGLSTNRVDVLLGTGSGTFAPRTSYALPGEGGSIAAGDLNGDGRADLVAGISFGTTVQVLVANPDGTFAAPVGYATTGGQVNSVALADLDLNGTLDVVARSLGASKATVWTGTGTGTLNQSVAFDTGVNPGDLALGDVTGDLLPDIVTPLTLSPASLTITRNTTSNAAPVITSNGGGDTASASVAENGTAVTTVTATDNPSQTLTFSIVGGADAAKFAINAATGALRFVTAPDFETPADAGANNVYDVTVQVSDGALTDTQALAVTVTDVTPTVGFVTPAATVIEGNSGTKTVVLSVVRTGDRGATSVRFATGAGTATSGRDYRAAAGTLAWAADDFSAKTIALAVIGDRSVEGGETFAVNLTNPTGGAALGSGAATVQVADNDRFSRFNWAMGTAAGGLVATYNTSGALSGFVTPFGGITVEGVRVATGDVDGDGADDLVAVPTSGSALVAVYSGATGSLITAFVGLPPEFGPGTVAVGDVNGDGRGDIILGTTRAIAAVGVYSGATFGLMSAFLPFGSFPVALNVAAGDTDGDGVDEIVVGAAGTLSAVGTFSAQGVAKSLFFAFGAAPIGVTVSAGDLNGDGVAEVVAGTASGIAGFGVFTGVGAVQGLYVSHQGAAAGITTTVADTNNDGRAEVVAANRTGPAVGYVFLPPAPSPVTFLLPFGFQFNGGIFVG